jgi:hypothetical protein
MIGDSNLQFPSGESTVAILHHSLSSPCSEGARPGGRSGAGPAAYLQSPSSWVRHASPMGASLPAKAAVIQFPSRQVPRTKTTEAGCEQDLH